MKIGDSYKKAINNTFVHTVFFKRDTKSIIKTLLTKVHGGSYEVIPPTPTECFKIENIDIAHDKLTLMFDDYVIDGVITWRINEDGNSVFMKYE
jgi:hypothetical protein